MSNKTTWRQIGMLRAGKYISFVIFIILLLGTLSNVMFYFKPDIVSEILPFYLISADAVSAYSLYSAILSGIVTVGAYCCYRYLDEKLNEAEDNKIKSSPEVMTELINFCKRHDALVSQIDSSKSLEEFDSLKCEVNNYNNDAETFAETFGVSPKFITFSDYDSKRDKFIQ